MSAKRLRREVEWTATQQIAMTKTNPCRALKKLIDTNRLSMNVDGWVEQLGEVGD